MSEHEQPDERPEPVEPSPEPPVEPFGTEEVQETLVWPSNDTGYAVEPFETEGTGEEEE